MKTIILTVILSMNLYAQDNWVELNHQQQKLLLPFESDWDKLDYQTRKNLLRNTDKWLNMSKIEKIESREKLNRFKQLSKKEQQILKDKHSRYKQLSLHKKKSLKKAYKRYNNLTPIQKRKLKQKFDNLNPKQRKKAISNLLTKQQNKRFIKEFDIDKRKPIIDMFLNIQNDNRDILKAHLKALSATERHKLTLQLLEMSPDERINYIQSIKI